ncbi:NADH:flavin oxidoreductase [Musicola paradisiaca]|uniref:NADH:flavin oxidoreductase/NADH oxidase n=1 Tax=Musicola paradisiaca (strain Ech703) TaxID=579405 RepID=C6C7N9_MUSP7|nr:NADH:flavin oxidoreductase [Musicola paradisiaca]ACS85981.1 NADH:flavin oxidoreductase/NADH oxidase [Musicola paradisiaca Ech703]
MANIDVLFRPFSLKTLTLKNRIVMAPMTRTFSPDGIPGDDVAAYYRRRAEGDVGLILSEGTVVDRPGARNHPGIPVFHGDAALQGWQNVIDEVHAAGGRMGPQIWHVGSVPLRDVTWEPDYIESPSGLVMPDVERGHAMTDEDIADTIAAFARAAADAKRLGFDTLELHGAHGYLIDQFFWGETNQRTDAFGGATIKQRARFAAEIVKSVRQAVGPDFPLILRVSQWKPQDYNARLAPTPLALEDWLAPLVAAGVDILHCSQRRFWEPEFPEVDGENGLNFAGWTKKVTGAATISVGSVGLSDEFISTFSGKSAGVASLDNLLERLERDEFDLIAVGRALLSNPDWAAKVHRQELDSLHGFDPASLGQLV